MFYNFRLFLILSLFSLGSCKNQFSDFPDRGGLAFLLDRTKQAIDEQEWDAAIANAESLLDSDPQNEEYAYLGAVAYAGRAGLRVLDLFLALTSGGTDKLFKIFADHFKDQTLEPQDLADIESAVRILETYGPTAEDRSQSVNFFAVFLFYGRIGIRLAYHGYTDGAITPGWDACSSTDLPDESVDVIMTSIPRMSDALSAIPGLNAGFDGSGLPAGINFEPVGCPASGDITDAAACLAVRNLVDGNAVGLNLGLGPCL